MDLVKFIYYTAGYDKFSQVEKHISLKEWISISHFVFEDMDIFNFLSCHKTFHELVSSIDKEIKEICTKPISIKIFNSAKLNVVKNFYNYILERCGCPIGFYHFENSNGYVLCFKKACKNRDYECVKWLCGILKKIERYPTFSAINQTWLPPLTQEEMNDEYHRLFLKSIIDLDFDIIKWVYEYIYSLTGKYPKYDGYFSPYKIMIQNGCEKYDKDFLIWVFDVEEKSKNHSQ